MRRQLVYPVRRFDVGAHNLRQLGDVRRAYLQVRGLLLGALTEIEVSLRDLGRSIADILGRRANLGDHVGQGLHGRVDIAAQFAKRPFAVGCDVVRQIAARDRRHGLVGFVNQRADALGEQIDVFGELQGEAALAVQAQALGQVAVDRAGDDALNLAFRGALFG